MVINHPIRVRSVVHTTGGTVMAVVGSVAVATPNPKESYCSSSNYRRVWGLNDANATTPMRIGCGAAVRVADLLTRLGFERTARLLLPEGDRGGVEGPK